MTYATGEEQNSKGKKQKEVDELVQKENCIAIRPTHPTETRYSKNCAADDWCENASAPHCSGTSHLPFPFFFMTYKT